MATYAVRELNFNQGLHAHVLIGIPEGAMDRKPNRPRNSFEDEAIATWCSLDHGGLPQGQNVQTVTGTAGVLNYMHKYVRNLDAMDNIDVMNLHIPEVSPTVLPEQDNQ